MRIMELSFLVFVVLVCSFLLHIRDLIEGTRSVLRVWENCRALRVFAVVWVWILNWLIGVSLRDYLMVKRRAKVMACIDVVVNLHDY